MSRRTAMDGESGSGGTGPPPPVPTMPAGLGPPPISRSGAISGPTANHLPVSTKFLQTPLDSPAHLTYHPPTRRASPFTTVPR